MSRTVLVVEDDLLIAEDMRIQLLELGWTVLGPAPSVEIAIDLLSTERPEVAVLDMQLGRELVTPVAAKLRELGVPFIMASSYWDLAAIGGPLFAGVVNVGKLWQSDHLHRVLLEKIAGI